MRIERVVFNAKFMSSKTKTGVHRVALELIRALDQMLDERDLGRDLDWVLLGPPDAEAPPPLKRIRFEKAGRLTWQFWEQLELPWLTRGDLLINLCNLAPIAKQHSIAMIHDAQTFRSPSSYSKVFAHYYQFILPIIGRRAERILTVSEFSREDLARYGVADAEKITVIHNGVDHVSCSPPDLTILDRLDAHDAPFAIAFASLQAHKNVGVLLEAFARAEMAGVRLIFVGAASKQMFLDGGYDVPANVTFAGRVSDGELAALFERAICLAFPSTTEGFGLPPLEAMIGGCPAVVAPLGALPEVCGDSAVYAAPHDPAAWAREILRLQAQPDERARLVVQGREQAAKFTWTRSAEHLLDVINDVRGQIA